MKGPRITGTLLVLLLGLLAGCAGYRLGPTSGRSPGTQSVEVRLFDNETLKPRLVEPVTFNLRRELQQDGTYRLATHETGDIIVKGTITDFAREELSFQPEDVLTVRDYTVTMAADVVAIERTSGRTNLHQQVEGRTTLRVGNDLTSAERQAIPLLARDLARNIKTKLVEGTW